MVASDEVPFEPGPMVTVHCGWGAGPRVRRPRADVGRKGGSPAALRTFLTDASTSLLLRSAFPVNCSSLRGVPALYQVINKWTNG